MWSQQPYYEALHFPPAAFGVLMALGSGLGGIASQGADRYQGRASTLHVLTAGWLVALAVCAAAGFHIGYLGVGLLMLGGSCVVGAAMPPVNTALNRTVASDRRGTLLSTQSFLNYLLFIPLSATIGWLSDIHGIQLGLGGLAGWLAVAGLGLFVFRTRIAKPA